MAKSMTKKRIILLGKSFIVALSLYLTACTLHTSIESLDKTAQDSLIDDKGKIVLKMMEEPLSLEIYEGSSVLFVISQSSFRNIDTAVELYIKSDLNDVSDVFPGLASVSGNVGKKDFKISSNQTLANLVINSNHNSQYTGDKVFILNFKTSDADVVNALPEITLKVKDLESQPQINLANSSMNLNENSGAQSVSINLNQASADPIVVNYSFTSGTATLVSDYIASAGSVTFAPGETTKTIPFSIVDDALVENGSAETFTLSLGSVVGSAILGTQSSMIVHIVDNDTESLSIANATSVEGSNVVFTVSLTQSSPNTISVDYATSNGTALAGTHYLSKSGNLVFAPGETSKTISVSSVAISSEVCANDRSFNLTLSNPLGASLAVATATGTITDPDVPSLSIANAAATEGSSLSFLVSLSAVCGNKNISFNYASSAISATSGTDYVAVNSTANIAAGNSSVALSVSSLQDSLYEGNETLSMTLSSAVNATISTASATGTINDDEVAQGSFSITGITGASDINVDAYLSNGTTAIVNWQASLGSTSYDVTLYENDGSTVKCATQNSTTTSIDFASYSCNLVLGVNYKVKVVAKVGVQSLDASNNLYSFYVNQSPVLGSGGNGNWYVLAGNSITIDALWAASPAVGVATDPEGDSLSFSSVASASLGTIANNSSSITYTAGAGSSGVETFSFTIVDSKGGALTQTMRIHVMTAYTWTGAFSSSWATVGNWCGSISADKRSCAGSASAPGATHTAIIDGTCVSANCTPTNSTLNISVAGLIINANGFTQGNYTVTVGTTTGFSMSAGTFTGSSSNVTINGSFTLSGGTFNSTSGTLILSRNISISSTATFNHNNGTVDLNRQYSSSNTLTLSSPVTFNHFVMRGHSSTTTISGTAKVNGTMTTNSGTGLSTFNGGVVELYGDVVLNNSNIAGSTVLRWKGSNNQTLTGVGIDANSEAPYLDIDKSGGVLTFVGSIPMRYYSYTAGTIDAGTSLVYWQITYSSNASYNFSSIPFYDLNIRPHNGTATLLGDMYVSRNLSISAATGNSTLNGHKIYVGGDLTMSSSGTGFMNPSTTTVVLNGSGNQTIDNGICTGVFPNVEIASTGGIVTIAGTPNFQNFVYTSGVVQVTASTVTFHREYTASYVLTPGPVQFNNVNIRSSNSTTTLAGSLIALGNFTVISGVGSATINGGQIQVGGNFSSPGLGGTVQFLFNGTSDVSITSTGVTKPSGKWTVNKSSGTISLASAVSLSAVGQSLDLLQGSINMAGYNLTINNSLSLSAGTSITKNGGVLTVSGISVADGPYGSGTVNP